MKKFEASRTFSWVKPEKIISLKNGYWYYNYDIQVSKAFYSGIEEGEGEERDQYNFVQVRIAGNPDYEKCAKAIIRAYIDSDQEFDIINSYNAYQLGVTDSAGEDYEEYLQLLEGIKEKVGKDFNKQADTAKSHTPRQADITKSHTPRQADITKLMLMTINTMSLDDQQSLEVKSLYPTWESFIGKQLERDMKVQYGGKLFKVVQTHTAQKGWEPSIHTASLFTEIVEDHAGTKEDPIPYPADGNMVIYNGKYYTENNILYICIRDSQQPLYTALANVVGNYVNLV